MGNADRKTTWKEIADYFGVSRHTAMRWHKIFPMPIRKIGRTIMVTVRDLRMWGKRAQSVIV